MLQGARIWVSPSDSEIHWKYCPLAAATSRDFGRHREQPADADIVRRRNEGQGRATGSRSRPAQWPAAPHGAPHGLLLLPRSSLRAVSLSEVRSPFGRRPPTSMNGLHGSCRRKIRHRLRNQLRQPRMPSPSSIRRTQLAVCSRIRTSRLRLPCTVASLRGRDPLAPGSTVPSTSTCETGNPAHNESLRPSGAYRLYTRR